MDSVKTNQPPESDAQNKNKNKNTLSDSQSQNQEKNILPDSNFNSNSNHSKSQDKNNKNKKILFRPDTRKRPPDANMMAYFIFLILFALAAIPFNLTLAAIEGVIAAALCLTFVRGRKQRRRQWLQYIDSITGSVNTAGKFNLINSPLPTMVFRPDTGGIIWSNEGFQSLTNMREGLFETRMDDVIPGFPVQWLVEGKRECPERLIIDNRRFRVFGSLARARGAEQAMIATTYWVETTEFDALKTRYEESRPVLAILLLDNYEDLVKTLSDAQRSALMAKIDGKINDWTQNGLLLHTERDRYICLFDEKLFDQFAAERFAILDLVREIRTEDGQSPTLSIGVGKDAEGFGELYKSAGVALETALSRGGDQAVVRSKLDFAFYGGRSKATEKRTKVKSRVMANALAEIMKDADMIYIMGHAFSDMDAVGAAAGINCAARALQKPCHIIIREDKSAARPLIEKLQAVPEYENIFMDPDEAFLQLQPGTLLIIVDTNRPELVESPQILESCNRVAVIDHHRRAASYIENAAFSFHETYASSASELVSELLQYMVNPGDLLKAEAEAMLAGIVLDTKHFAQRTGGRTFEAAAFLRRCGADTENVQKLFQNDLKEMVARYDIIRRAEIYDHGIAIAVAGENADRVTAAQAADELLTLKGARASFVIYSNQNAALISARSLGDINVQVILEPLGGGGNSTVAGGRIENAAPAEIRARIIESIERYFETA